MSLIILIAIFILDEVAKGLGQHDSSWCILLVIADDDSYVMVDDVLDILLIFIFIDLEHQIR